MTRVDTGTGFGLRELRSKQPSSCSGTVGLRKDFTRTSHDNHIPCAHHQWVGPKTFPGI